MLNKIRKLRAKKGFTLVELIVVIAIIAILTAVIVPLVGRYSAQATYTTLNDSAKTISNSTNTVISDVTMMGSVISSVTVTGSKSNNTLTIADSAGTTPADFKTKLQASLQDAVPNGAVFVINITTNTVGGVRYSTTETLANLQGGTVGTVDGFNEAYQLTNGSKVTPVGVAGNQTPATTTDSDSDSDSDPDPDPE